MKPTITDEDGVWVLRYGLTHKIYRWIIWQLTKGKRDMSKEVEKAVQGVLSDLQSLRQYDNEELAPFLDQISQIEDEALDLWKKIRMNQSDNIFPFQEAAQ